MTSHTQVTALVPASNIATTSIALSMTTTAPAAQQLPSAGSRVACVPELLEHILLYLASQYDAVTRLHTHLSGYCYCYSHRNNTSIQTLLLCQRTSRVFHDTIRDSPKLQRALFFAPDDTLANPDIIVPNKRPDFNISIGESGFINPLLHSTHPDPSATWLEFCVNKDWVLRYDFESLLEHAGPDTDRAQSWRRMYVCRGQVDGSETKPWALYDGGRFAFHGLWENPTLGEVFDSLHGDWTKRQQEKGIVWL